VIGVLVRFFAVALGIVAISSPASATPSARIPVSPSGGAILIEEFEESFAPFRPAVRPEDCRQGGLVYRRGECAPPERKPPPQPKEASKPVPAKKTASIPPLPVKKPAGSVSVRALSDQERALQAPKPLITASSKAPAVPPAKTDKKTAETPVRAMLGQLFLSGFKGKRTSDADVARVASALRAGNLSGVVLGDANVANFRQLRQLVAAIKKESAGSYPLVAIEQPGGPDSVLSEDRGFVFYASASAIGSERDPYGAQMVYRDMAAELASVGVNLNIGPSGDICRDEGVDLSAACFGTAPARVAAYATAFHYGHHDRGVLTALRHAPFSIGMQQAWRTERPSAAILRGLAKAEQSDALVIRVKATEPGALNELHFAGAASRNASALRRAYGFHGAIIYDLDLGAGGAPLRYDEAIVRAFASGADIVMVRNASVLPMDLAAIGAGAVEAGLKSGRLQQARIDEAYRHVKRLKQRLRRLQTRSRMAEIFGQ
jgi:beta-N-acetylhexosaminidase